MISVGVISAVLLSPSASAQTYGGATVLTIKPGEAAPAMGQAGVALYQGPFSLWWNPALLRPTPGIEIGLSSAQLVPDLADNVWYSAYGLSVSLTDWITAGAYRLSYEDDGDADVGVGTRPDEESVWCVGAAVSHPMDIRGGVFAPSLGLGLKYVNVDRKWEGHLPAAGTDDEASAFAVDIGLLSRFVQAIDSVHVNASLGANFQNLGGKLDFGRQVKDPLPRNLKIGLGIEATAYAIDLGFGGKEKPDLIAARAAFDVNETLLGGDYADAEGILDMGFEVRLAEILSLRTGCIRDREGEIDNWGFDDFSDWNFGIGLNFKSAWFADFPPVSIRLNYSNVPQALDLDRVHYWAVSLDYERALFD